MARPKKNTVDYFPHKCLSGKTIYILEQKFGNNGYAFWFKLLQLLGSNEGHYIDCNNASNIEFLQATTRTDEITTVEILSMLAKLDAIDAELWNAKVIWSQNFVDGISDVYRNRRVEIPTRPSFYILKPIIEPITTSKSTQSKVKESKGEESKENYISPRQKLIEEWFERAKTNQYTLEGFCKNSNCEINEYEEGLKHFFTTARVGEKWIDEKDFNRHAINWAKTYKFKNGNATKNIPQFEPIKK